MRQVGLILEDGFQLMGLAALTAFEFANAELGAQGYRLTILSERGGTIRSSMNAGIETVPIGVMPDTLMVAGELLPQEVSPGLNDYVARAGDEARRVAGVCTGAFVLAQAGLSPRQIDALIASGAARQDADPAASATTVGTAGTQA